jgi:hypothetical protein
LLLYRHYLSPAIEVPTDANVKERPWTVVLAEDIGWFDDGVEQIQASWTPRFAAELPRQHGISFRTWRPSSRPTRGDESSISHSTMTTASTLHNAQLELQDDLASIPRLILVARGPVLSWMASFYLESMPASGVILVDPLSFTDEELCESASTRVRFMDQYLQYQNVTYPLQARHRRLLNVIQANEGWDDILQLEPGSVPMAVFSTMHIRNTWKFHAHLMAARHTELSYTALDDEERDGPKVPVIGLTGHNDPELVEAVADFCIHRARW